VSPVTWVGFVAAGAVGAPVRYLLDNAISSRTHGVFPWGTLVINVSGSFLLGLLTGLALFHGFPATPRLILGTGFCGAYTTFSTFAYETVRLAEEGAVNEAVRNALASLVLGAGAAAAGLAAAAL
jgi:CrcB protein